MRFAPALGLLAALACRDHHVAASRHRDAAQRSLAQERLIRSDSIVLERYTMCGDCRSYRLTLRRSGSSDFVVLLGAIEPPKQFVVADSTLAALDEQIFFRQIRSLPDSVISGAPLCGPFSTDGGSVALRIYAEGTTTLVFDDLGCSWSPAILRDLERAIDSAGHALNAIHITNQPGVVGASGVGLGGLAAPVRAQRRVAEERAPKGLVDQIMRDEGAIGYALLREELDAGGWLAIIDRVDLDGDGTPELFVQGRSKVCGAANCLAWIYRVIPNGYEQLLDADGVISIEARKTVHHGYRDVLTESHEAFDWSDLTLYRFDGERYQIAECSTARGGAGYLGKDGRIHGVTPVRITRADCQTR